MSAGVSPEDHHVLDLFARQVRGIEPLARIWAFGSRARGRGRRRSMTEAEKIRSLVAYRIEQANEALRAAEVNLANGLERSAVNRAYDAMFYAVLALLIGHGREFSSAVIDRLEQAGFLRQQ